MLRLERLLLDCKVYVHTTDLTVAQLYRCSCAPGMSTLQTSADTSYIVMKPVQSTEPAQLFTIITSIASTGLTIFQYLQNRKKSRGEHDNFLEVRLLWDIARTNSRLLVVFMELLQTVERCFWD
ncbi:hypothetical protein UY3_11728 [Chelonia mydas]|uniref:Uncharacterized protein n=1 Tax=Chelonia mydas TaxID=8469 RepID=M7B253_CHEMY|nr:hypothetical protein UY3_11728 [Chelonia mydas]